MKSCEFPRNEGIVSIVLKLLLFEKGQGELFSGQPRLETTLNLQQLKSEISFYPP